MNELIKRSLVALIGIPIAVAVIWLGGWLFTVIIAILSSMALWEFYLLAEHKGSHPFKYTGMILNIAIIFLMHAILAAKTGFDIINPGIIIVFLVTMTILTVSAFALWSLKANAILNFAVTLAGIIYISFSFSAIILIRNFSILNIGSFGITDFQRFLEGKEIFLFLSILFSIWISDTASYFIGKKLGKHKLFPSVSPKKTWEGAIAGFISGTAFFWLCLVVMLGSWFEFVSDPAVHALMLGVIISSIGQIGDLAESKLKRDAGVKDSSNILPGHGGILDRFDSMMFVFPAVLVYLFILL